jgi:hypothetical protein
LLALDPYGVTHLADLLEDWGCRHAKVRQGRLYFDGRPGLWHALDELCPLQDPNRWDRLRQRSSSNSRVEDGNAWLLRGAPASTFPRDRAVRTGASGRVAVDQPEGSGVSLVWRPVIPIAGDTGQRCAVRRRLRGLTCAAGSPAADRPGVEQSAPGRVDPAGPQLGCASVEEQTSLISECNEVVLLVIYLVVVVATVVLARRRGRTGWVWGFLALAFSVLATLAVALLPSRASRSV